MDNPKTEELLETITLVKYMVDCYASGTKKSKDKVLFEKALDNLDAIAEIVKGKDGRWIIKDLYSKILGMTISKSVCSVCNVDHEEVPFGEWNYCPSCGTKMDGERKEKA